MRGGAANFGRTRTALALTTVAKRIAIQTWALRGEYQRSKKSFGLTMRMSPLLALLLFGPPAAPSDEPHGCNGDPLLDLQPLCGCLRADPGVPRCPGCSTPRVALALLFRRRRQSALLRLKADDELAGTPECESNLGCSLNGDCVSGRCKCHSGWDGPRCGRLQLLPTTLQSGGYISSSAMQPPRGAAAQCSGTTGCIIRSLARWPSTAVYRPS